MISLFNLHASQEGTNLKNANQFLEILNLSMKGKNIGSSFIIFECQSQMAMTPGERGAKASQRVTGGSGGNRDGPKQSHDVLNSPLPRVEKEEKMSSPTCFTSEWT
jgi:hypothetical protein